MVSLLSVVFGYFIVLIAIGFIAKRQEKKTAEDFFLASRSIGTFVMVLSVFSTLYSAFTFIALPGLIYKTGIGFIAGLPVSNVLFTTMIFLIGYKVWLAGRKFGFITPTELFKHRFQSTGVAIVIFIVMVIFVIPYISIQPIGGGYVLSTVTKNAIPYMWSAAIISLVMIIYVFYGGFRGVAWIDAFQAIIMLVVSVATLGFAVYYVGGFTAGSARVAAEYPKFLTPAGPVNLWVWPNVFSWIVFVVLNFLFQPPIFARYYSGKSISTIKWTCAVWPILATIMLMFPILTAMYGRVLFPNLKVPDNLIPMLWMQYAPPWFCGLGAAAVLSALMSTASGQLMVLSSMWTRDIYTPYINKGASQPRQVLVGRTAVVVLAIAGFIIAIKPPALLGLMAGAAFSGISILAPAGLAAFYWKRATAPAAMASIIGGEIPVVLTYFGLVPKTTWGKFDAAIPGLIIATVLLVVISYLTKQPSKDRVDAYFSPDMDIFKSIRKS
jgi:solute:Na+ symporter, SSS family